MGSRVVSDDERSKLALDAISECGIPPLLVGTWSPVVKWAPIAARNTAIIHETLSLAQTTYLGV